MAAMTARPINTFLMPSSSKRCRRPDRCRKGIAHCAVTGYSYASTSRTVSRDAFQAGRKLATAARTITIASHRPTPMYETLNRGGAVTQAPPPDPHAAHPPPPADHRQQHRHDQQEDDDDVELRRDLLAQFDNSRVRTE